MLFRLRDDIMSVLYWFLYKHGANVMAKEGKKYDEILKHYYTGIKIQNLRFEQ